MPSSNLRFRALLAVLATLLGLHHAAFAEDLPKPKAEHVVLVVWDGMRPDFINSENTPNLTALAARGTFFENNHSFWPTTTEVNGTVLATGVFPARSTVVANREFRPEIDPRGPFGTESVLAIRKGDDLTGGHYLGVPTVAEITRLAGGDTAIAGTKGVALLHDRAAERPASPRSAIFFGGKALPEALLDPALAAFGPFPPYRVNPLDPQPNTPENLWTTRVLLEQLWSAGVPRYSLLWLSDPDFPQHATSPGHPAAMAGIKASDRHLGLLVAALQEKGVLEKTDIFVVSDHGFSTIGRTVDPMKYYAAHGIAAVRSFTGPPQPGSVLSLSVGGLNALYVTDHDPALTTRLVRLLQASDFAGPIFTRTPFPGTFTLHQAHIDSPAAADVVFSFRWRDAPNAYGVRGLIDSEGRSGAGMHGALSKWDIHNTLVAAGPDIRSAFRDSLPTGNIDVAPTILHLLGESQPAGADGRILTEALADTPLPSEKPQPGKMTAESKLEDGTTWRQTIKTTTFAGKTYFDEGNAAAVKGKH